LAPVRKRIGFNRHKTPVGRRRGITALLQRKCRALDSRQQLPAFPGKSFKWFGGHLCRKSYPFSLLALLLNGMLTPSEAFYGFRSKRVTDGCGIPPPEVSNCHTPILLSPNSASQTVN